MPMSPLSRCSSSASLDSCHWKNVELETLPMSYSSASSSALSTPTKIREFKNGLELESGDIQNLTKELEKAELENAIFKQKMDILGLEISDISKKFEKCQADLEGKRLKFEQLFAGNRMAGIVLKNQLNEIEKRRKAGEMLKDQLEKLRATQQQEKNNGIVLKTQLKGIETFRLAEKILKHQQEKHRVTQQQGKENYKPWNYGESWRSHQTVKTNEKKCDKNDGSEEVKLLVKQGYKKAEAEHIMKQVMEIRKMQAGK